MHSLITDLIVQMPTRVKEIRLHDEDVLRRAGFDPSSTGSGFANFLLLISDLYNQPGSRLHARLALEYWWPSGELTGMGMTTSCGGGGGTLVGLKGAEFLSGFRGLPARSPSKAAALQGRNNETENIRQVFIRMLWIFFIFLATKHLFFQSYPRFFQYKSLMRLIICFGMGCSFASDM